MQTKNNWKAWLYLAPVIILLAIFTFYPLINTIGTSFLKNYSYGTGESDGFSFDNYAIVLGLKPFIDGTNLYERYVIKYAIPNTLIITFVTVPISIFISLFIAIGLNRIKVFNRFFQTIFFLPYVTNAIAVGMVFNVIFDQQGVFNFFFGLNDFNWLHGTTEASRWPAMFALCFFIVWKSLSYKILIFSSGLQSIDKQYYDAAKMDSTPSWKVAGKITVPLLSPQILYITITSFIGAFKEYTNVVGLFNGPQTSPAVPYNMYTIVYYIYDSLAADNVAWACATAVMLFLVILLFTFIEMQVAKKRVHY